MRAVRHPERSEDLSPCRSPGRDRSLAPRPSLALALLALARPARRPGRAQPRRPEHAGPLGRVPVQGEHVAGPERAAAEDRADGPGQHGRPPARAPIRSDGAAGRRASVRSHRDGARRGTAPALLPALGVSQGRRRLPGALPGETGRHRRDLRDRGGAAARGGGRGIHGRARPAPGALGVRAQLAALRQHRERPPRPRRRGRAAGAGRQHGALVPVTRLSVRVGEGTGAGGQRRQPRRAHRAGGSRPPGEGAPGRGRRERDDSRAGDRPPAPGRARRLVRRPRRRAGTPGAHGHGHHPARHRGRAARFGRRLERRGHARRHREPEAPDPRGSRVHLLGRAHVAGHLDRPELARRSPEPHRGGHGTDRHRGAGESGAGALPAQPHGIPAVRRRPARLAGGRALRRVPERPPGPERGGRVRELAGLVAGAAPLAVARLLDLLPAGLRLRHRIGPPARGSTCRSSGSSLRARRARWTRPATGTPSRSRAPTAGSTGSPTRGRDT